MAVNNLSSLGYAGQSNGSAATSGYAQVPSNYSTQSSSLTLPGGATVSPYNQNTPQVLPGGATVSPYNQNTPQVLPGGGMSATPAQQTNRMVNMSAAGGFTDPFGSGFSWVGNPNSVQQDWLAGQTSGSPFDVNDPLNQNANWGPNGRTYHNYMGDFATQSDMDAAVQADWEKARPQVEGDKDAGWQTYRTAYPDTGLTYYGWLHAGSPTSPAPQKTREQINAEILQMYPALAG